MSILYDMNGVNDFAVILARASRGSELQISTRLRSGLGKGGDTLGSGFFLLVAIALISLAGCGTQDASSRSSSTATDHGSVGRPTVGDDDDLQALSRKFERILSALASDSRRNEKRFELEFTRDPNMDDEPLRQFFIDAIARWEPELNRNRYCTREEREEGLARLRQHDFTVDPNIAPQDLDEIVAYIEANAFLDSRILSLRRVDHDTVEVTTGVVRGPLNGGGHVYMARRENGAWIVRHSSGWVS